MLEGAKVTDINTESVTLAMLWRLALDNEGLDDVTTPVPIEDREGANLGGGESGGNCKLRT